MTANQIANQALKEEARHNAEVEAETNRHNLATETLEQDKLNLQQWYETRTTQLTEWYNEQYIAYLNASNEDKVALEAELNEIKRQQVEIDDTYKRQMAALEGRSLDITQSHNEVTEQLKSMDQDIQRKWNEYQESYQNAMVAQQQYSNDIKMQDVMATATWRANQLELSAQQNDIASQRNLFDYELGLEKNQIAWDTLKISQRKMPYELSVLDAQANLMKQQKTNYQFQIVDMFNPFSQKAASNAMKLFELFP